MKNAIIFFFSILLIASCKKDFEGIEIKGRITEVGSGKPVAGAKVFIIGIGPGDGFLSPGNGNESIVDTVFSNENGDYRFRREDSPFGGYRIIIKRDKYQDKYPSRGIDWHSVNTFDIQLQPYAWVKIHLKNVNNISNFSWVKLNGSWINWESDKYVLNAKNLDQIIFETLLGNKSQKFTLKNYTTNINIDTSVIFLPAHDTIPINFYF